MGMREGQLKAGCHRHCCEQGHNCPGDFSESQSPSSSTALLRVDPGVMAATRTRTAVPAGSKKLHHLRLAWMLWLESKLPETVHHSQAAIGGELRAVTWGPRATARALHSPTMSQWMLPPQGSLCGKKGCPESQSQPVPHAL